MTKHLIVQDIHARRRPPSRCTDTYWPDLLGLLGQTVELAREAQVSTVTWAGDIFDHKAPGRTDHGLVQDLIGIVQAYSCSVFGIPGNHDMQHDRIESVGSTQPLGVLFRAGLTPLSGWAGDDGTPAWPVYGVPWLQRWTEDTVHEALAGYREQVFTRGTGRYGVLVITHAPIYPPPDEPRYEGAEFTPARWWSAAMNGLGWVCYGHIHEPHGVWEHDGVTFCNYGALSRGSLDEYNLDRRVGCTIWDDKARTFSFAPLRARPASEVFLTEQAASEADARGRLDAFLASFDQVRLPRLSVEGVIAHLRTQNLTAEVVELAEELLTAAAHEGRKS
jgi:DNA repair exonuclease SbcCD nuclease subunit